MFDLSTIDKSVSTVGLLVTLLAMPFLIVNWLRFLSARRKEKNLWSGIKAHFPVKSAAFFITPLVFCIAISTVRSSIATNNEHDFLYHLPNEYSVLVDGEQVSNREQIVTELKKIGYIEAHHSHPTTTIQVKIESQNRRLILELKRDSDRPQEYWVYSPEYGNSTDIGRLVTGIFDSY